MAEGWRAGGQAWCAVVGAVAALVALGGPAGASWLDEPSAATWNRAGAGVPPAPRVKGNDDPRCRAAERRPETAPDRAVARAGWKLFREYQGGWGVTLVWGLVTYDGMCRPVFYQVFAFVGGRFAGTLAPAPMVSRTEGSLTAVTLAAAPAGAPAAPIAATFNRYAESDPLCCPSRTTRVRYHVEGRGAGARIAPGAAETQATAR